MRCKRGDRVLALSLDYIDRLCHSVGRGANDDEAAVVLQNPENIQVHEAVELHGVAFVNAHDAPEMLEPEVLALGPLASHVIRHNPVQILVIFRFAHTRRLAAVGQSLEIHAYNKTTKFHVEMEGYTKLLRIMYSKRHQKSGQSVGT
jgi:hypothetical protein